MLKELKKESKENKDFIKFNHGSVETLIKIYNLDVKETNYTELARNIEISEFNPNFAINFSIVPIYLQNYCYIYYR
jgi:hypothetical protein